MFYCMGTHACHAIIAKPLVSRTAKFYSKHIECINYNSSNTLITHTHYSRTWNWHQWVLWWVRWILCELYNQVFVTFKCSILFWMFYKAGLECCSTKCEAIQWYFVHASICIMWLGVKGFHLEQGFCFTHRPFS